MEGGGWPGSDEKTLEGQCCWRPRFDEWTSLAPATLPVAQSVSHNFRSKTLTFRQSFMKDPNISTQPGIALYIEATSSLFSGMRSICVSGEKGKRYVSSGYMLARLSFRAYIGSLPFSGQCLIFSYVGRLLSASLRLPIPAKALVLIWVHHELCSQRRTRVACKAGNSMPDNGICLLARPSLYMEPGQTRVRFVDHMYV